MIRSRVLVVEDDESVREFYEYFFMEAHKNEFEWCLVKTGEQALASLSKNPIDIVILDWNLPRMSGPETLRYIRSNPITREIRVFMVTGRTNPKDAVVGLRAGADDYLRKPFDPDELLERLRCLMRRTKPASMNQHIYEVDGLYFDAKNGNLTIDGKLLKLVPIQLALLEIFLRRPHIHAPQALWDMGWGYRSKHWKHTLVAHVGILREGLGPGWGKRIETHYGKGYTLNLQTEVSATPKPPLSRP